MDDLISREKAIEALQEHRNLFCDNTPETFSKLSYAEKSRVDELDMAIATLINLPSAQPDSKETSYTHKALDTISRQAAIDAILAVTGNSSVRELYEHVQEHGLSDMWSGGVNAAIDIIIAVPSAQPEIIWCKDCKYWMRAYLSISGKHGCNVMRDYTAPDDYCFKAERKA